MGHSMPSRIQSNRNRMPHLRRLSTAIAILLLLAPPSFAQLAPRGSALQSILNQAPRAGSPSIPPITPREKNVIGQAYVYSQQGKLDQAISALSQARGSGASPQFDYTLAQMYQQNGDIAQAIQTYQDAVNKAPGFALAHQGLGVLLLTKTPPDYEKAAAAFAQAYEAGIRDPDILNYMAQCYINLSLWPEAEACLRKGLELRPGDERLQVLLAYALDEQGRSDEADAFRPQP